MTADLYFLAAEQDHIAPWRRPTPRRGCSAATVRFVLSNSGHIAGIVNPRPPTRRSVLDHDDLPADPTTWLAARRPAPRLLVGGLGRVDRGTGPAPAPAAADGQPPPTRPSPTPPAPTSTRRDASCPIGGRDAPDRPRPPRRLGGTRRSGGRGRRRPPASRGGAGRHHLAGDWASVTKLAPPWPSWSPSRRRRSASTIRPARRARPSATCWPTPRAWRMTPSRCWPRRAAGASTPTPASRCSAVWWPTGRAWASTPTWSRPSSRPLGMAGARLEGSPADGVAGSLDDLVRLAGELLAPTLVAPGDARSRHHGGLPRPGRRLPGFDTRIHSTGGWASRCGAPSRPTGRAGATRPATFGHFGQQRVVPLGRPGRRRRLRRAQRARLRPVGQGRRGRRCPTPCWAWARRRAGRYHGTGETGSAPSAQGRSGRPLAVGFGPAVGYSSGLGRRSIWRTRMPSSRAPVASPSMA